MPVSQSLRGFTWHFVWCPITLLRFVWSPFAWIWQMPMSWCPSNVIRVTRWLVSIIHINKHISSMETSKRQQSLIFFVLTRSDKHFVFVSSPKSIFTWDRCYFCVGCVDTYGWVAFLAMLPINREISINYRNSIDLLASLTLRHRISELYISLSLWYWWVGDIGISPMRCFDQAFLNNQGKHVQGTLLHFFRNELGSILQTCISILFDFQILALYFGVRLILEVLR